MKRMNSLVTAAVVLIFGTIVSYAQYGSGRALLAYPMKGQTLEQENADRAACHDWAVAQTGYDPTLVYAAQHTGSQLGLAPQRLIRTPSLPKQAGRIFGAMGNAERLRLNELYYAYLRAGEVCLEARGYEVSR